MTRKQIILPLVVIFPFSGLHKAQPLSPFRKFYTREIYYDEFCWAAISNTCTVGKMCVENCSLKQEFVGNDSRCIGIREYYAVKYVNFICKRRLVVNLFMGHTRCRIGCKQLWIVPSGRSVVWMGPAVGRSRGGMLASSACPGA